MQYPEYLDLGAYMSQAAGEPLVYSLYAVVVHEGSGCEEGHYYCFVKVKVNSVNSVGVWCPSVVFCLWICLKSPAVHLKIALPFFAGQRWMVVQDE